MADITIDPKHTAVLVLDYLVGIVSDDARRAALAKATPVVKAARSAGLTIVYGTLGSGFEDDRPIVHPRNWSLVNFRGGGRFRRGSEDVKIHPDVAPQEDDIIIDRQRAGIFSGTSLDLMLRSREIGQLAIFGISTSGQVLSAVRWGVDLDYDQYVLEDCCADKDEEVHRMLMSKVLSMHSKVISSEDFLAAIK